MPYIYQEVEVDIEDFLDACNESDLKRIISRLKKGDLYNDIQAENISVLDSEWNDVISKLANARLQLTNEEEEVIKKIANRL